MSIAPLLHEIGWTVGELARRCDVGQRTAARWVSGRLEAPPDVRERLERLAAAVREGSRGLDGYQEEAGGI